MQKKGPWNETPADRLRAKDRGGYPHAGHVNWFDRLTPSSGVPTILPKTSFYLPGKDKDTVLVEDNNYPQTRNIRKQTTVPTMAQFSRDRAPLVATRSVREVAPLGFNVYGSGTAFYHDSRDQQKSMPEGIISPKMSPDKSRSDTSMYGTPQGDVKSSPSIMPYSHPLVQDVKDERAQLQIDTSLRGWFNDVFFDKDSGSTGDNYGAGSPSSGSSYKPSSGGSSIDPNRVGVHFPTIDSDTEASPVRAYSLPSPNTVARRDEGRRHTDIVDKEEGPSTFSARTSVGNRSRLAKNLETPVKKR